MSEQLHTNGEENWEIQRRTGRFAFESETTADANAWLEAAGLPPVENETYKQWADRTAEERGTL